MAVNMKLINVNYTFVITSLVLLFILFIRVTKGLDLTDEMQYYGEIKGLIDTGTLFSNDLFIQQTVYILIYPLFYLYSWFFGFDGFIFFGRLIMAVISIAVFIYAYRKFVELKFSIPLASLTALSLTFAIPFHGIFAPSYNTISQALWIIFALKFFEWKRGSTIAWGVLPVIMAFAHPASAVMMSLLIVIRFVVEHEFKQLTRLFLVFLGGALLVLPVIFYFAELQQYIASLRFSSGYGVGKAFFSNKSQPISLFIIYGLFGAGLFFSRFLEQLNFTFFMIISLVCGIFLFSAGLAGGAYTTRVLYTLSSLCILAYVWLLSNNVDNKLTEKVNWLVIVLLVYAATLGVTSSNGIGQATGTFMVGLPLLLGIAVSSRLNQGESSKYQPWDIVCLVLVFTLFVAHWSRNPYREVAWWDANATIKSIPEFRFISTSQDRVSFIQHMRSLFLHEMQGKRSLIVSKYPGLYFALDAQPETCMLYMHSVSSNKSEEVLMNCLNQKKPEIILNIIADNSFVQGNSRIKNILNNFLRQRGFNCNVGQFELGFSTTHNPVKLKYSICK
jgi:hypothetical protein